MGEGDKPAYSTEGLGDRETSRTGGSGQRGPRNTTGRDVTQSIGVAKKFVWAFPYTSAL